MSVLAICSIGLEVEGIRRLVPHIKGNFEAVEDVDGEVSKYLSPFFVLMICTKTYTPLSSYSVYCCFHWRCGKRSAGTDIGS